MFRSVLFLSFVAAVVCCQCAVTQASTIGFWVFNEGASGDTAALGSTLVDSSGNGHNGTLGHSATTYVAGDTAKGGASALHFAGSSVDMLANSAYAFAAGSAFTVEADIRTAVGQSNTNGYVIQSKNLSAPAGEWWIRHGYSSRLEPLAYDGGPNAGNFEGAATINDGNWHHVAMVYDGAASGGTLTTYVDYAQDGVQTGIGMTGTIGSSTNGLSIGHTDDPTGTNYFAGDIEFVRLSTGALTPDQFVHTLSTPEPGSVVLLVTGLLGLLAYAWRKRR